MSEALSGAPDAPTSEFIGRARELSELTRLVARFRLVTLVGPGGSGKTRLALEVLRHLARSPRQEARIADLTSLRDPDLVEAAVARALGIAITDESQPLAQLERALAGRQVILLLDNCEHLVDTCARVAGVLARLGPGLRLIATSREVLGVDGERVWMVPSLVPDEALRLFMGRARARGAGIPAESASTVAEICRRLDHMPLAIELAAARAAMMTPAEILRRLDDRFALLSGGSRAGSDRHRSLRSAVEWSYSLLEAEESALFRRLSVFTGGFDLEAVEALAGMAGIDLLSRLIDKSLVSIRPGEGAATRYAMLETLAEYGRERLLESGVMDSARGEHLMHFVARAETAFSDRRSSGSAELLQRLDQDIDNIRSALAWAGLVDPCAGLRLVAATREVWYRLGQAEGLAVTRRLVAACPGRGPAMAWALVAAGQLAVTQLQHHEARRDLGEAAELARELGDQAIQAWAQWLLGVSHFLSEEFSEAKPHLEESIRLHRSAGDGVGLGSALSSLGTVQLRLGHRQEAIALLTEALQVAEPAGDRWGIGFAQTYLGIAHLAGGERTQADRVFRSALSTLAPIRDVTMLTLALAGLGELAAAAGQWNRAMRLAGAAEGLRGRLAGPFPPWIAGSVAELRGRGERALGTDTARRRWEEGSRLDAGAATRLAEGLEAPPASAGALSARETEIAGMVAEGLANAEIAARLGISRRTVENHVLHILNKLGVENRTQVAAWFHSRD